MKTKDHTQYSDDEFEAIFSSYKLKPLLFSHEAHIRLAYIHIKKYGAKQAEDNMCAQIKGYAESLGAFEKFNITVSIAAVKILSHFMAASERTDFNGLILEFPEIITDFKGLVMQHYSYNVFADKKAKAKFLEPDKAPFNVK